MPAQSLNDIEIALEDLSKICREYSIDYRVIGSCAMVANSDRLYRLPADVDVLFDESKKEHLERGLLKKGYAKHVHSNKLDSVLASTLERFVKKNSVIEPRGGKFIDGRFESKLLIPIPFLPKAWKPKATLVFTPLLFQSRQLRLGNVSFYGLSKEALLFIFSMSRMPMQKVEGKILKRVLDEQFLNKDFDSNLLEKIEKEDSGIYFFRLPLVTFKSKIFLNLLTNLAQK